MEFQHIHMLRGFEKAFDKLWKIMKHYGIHDKITRLVQNMYNNSQCAVFTGNGRTEWFEVKSGLKPGSNIYGFPFY
jgi:hypothetical protein